MRKLSIVEIENSYLNFFTPAVIVAVGYFLFNLIGWPMLFLQWLMAQSGMEVNPTILDLLLRNSVFFLSCVVVYIFFIPKLKIADTEYKRVDRGSFVVFILLSCVMIFLQQLLVNLLEFFGWILIDELDPSIIVDYQEIQDPFVLILFLLSFLILETVFSEIIYRRTMIPLLEDRGLSPIHAVIMSALGHGFVQIPSYIIVSNYPNVLYNFTSLILFGLCAGIIYILSRNILFPILFGLIYNIHILAGAWGSLFEGGILLMVYNLSKILSLIVGLIVIIFIIWKLIIRESTTEWVEIIKRQSAPFITRGLIGFFVISLGLLALQTAVVKIGHNVTENTFPQYFSFITIFYLIAFSVPFWFTITTEYAKS